MRQRSLRAVGRSLGWSLLLVVSASACHPGDILTVPPPAGVVAGSALASQTGAESVMDAATYMFAEGYQGDYTGVLEWADLLSDEFTYSQLEYGSNTVDARITLGVPAYYDLEPSDGALGYLFGARGEFLLAAPALAQYEPVASKSKAAEAYALAGYIELVFAEDYCAGAPLSGYKAEGGVYLGTPLTTDSLFATAEAHFDSAISAATGNDSLTALASIGLGRARLGRGHYADAVAAVANVPTGYVYGLTLQSSYSAGGPDEVNLYGAEFPDNGCGFLNVGDREGTNGLNFGSANDARLVLSTTLATTCDGQTWYYPVKFGYPSIYIPLATGVEARLIEAEAALQNNDVPGWMTDLNTLRANAPATYLQTASPMDPLTSDSTANASPDLRVDVMFRERAFWLFGTGTRLGDMRRLVRQYGRNIESVYPTGPYAGAAISGPPVITTYGTDVDLPMPAKGGYGATNNPSYVGCLTSTKVA